MKKIKQNKNIEEIFKGRKKIATIIRSSAKTDGLFFLTEEREPLQVAIHNYQNKKIGRIHGPHKKVELLITEKHKFLYVEEGKVKVTFFDLKNNEIVSKILNKGDSIVVTNISHKFDFYPNSKVFEIKQGPYEI